MSSLSIARPDDFEFSLDLFEALQIFERRQAELNRNLMRKLKDSGKKVKSLTDDIRTKRLAPTATITLVGCLGIALWKK